jgi:hypothetical protein
MAKQTGVLIDDARLRGRDNSFAGLDQSGEFGDSGKVTGGEPNMTAAEDVMSGDEFTAGRSNGKAGKGGY